MKKTKRDKNSLLICIAVSLLSVVMCGLVLPVEDGKGPVSGFMLLVRDNIAAAGSVDKGVAEPSVKESTVAANVTTAENKVPASTAALPSTAPTATAPPSTAKPTKPEKPATSAPTAPSETSTSSKDETVRPWFNMALPQLPGIEPSDEEYFSSSLFIGDSRTVGLYSYSKIPYATYFAYTSMSVYSIFNSKHSETADTSKYTLDGLLADRDFKQIYILLGINEIGSDYSSIVNKYSGAIEKIRDYQPDAKIIIQSNMHVTKSKSDAYPKSFNNGRINELNHRLSELADNKKIYYLGFEHIFDDGNGNLSPDYTGDGVHLYGKYYKLWHDWIMENGKIY